MSANKEVMNALTQLKQSSLMKLDANHDLAKEAIQNHYNFISASPEDAAKALEILSSDSNRIYLDYLERLTRLNEEVTQRLMDSANNALKKALVSKKTSRAKTRSVKPKTRSVKPKTRSVKPKTRSVKPKTRSVKPKTR